jgi:protein-L-isoaspartate(D-aspartate) O-methyltransferase
MIPRIVARVPVFGILAGFLILSCASQDVPSPLPVEEARQRMVDHFESFDVEGGRSVTDPRVLEAMREIPRHEFVLPEHQDEAYADTALPIEAGQTISQLYIVALMTELVAPEATDRILEIGTGSGYQAAVVSLLVDEVYSIEIVPELASSAAGRLSRLGYENVQVREGDGYLGWPEEAPFDGILVTAGAPGIPEPLVEQLRPGGRMVIPVGEAGEVQTLEVLEKDIDGSVSRREIIPVRFVPLVRD